jgi:RNA-directed DNA polymerase
LKNLTKQQSAKIRFKALASPWQSFYFIPNGMWITVIKKTKFDPINLLSLNDLAWRLGENRTYLKELAANAEAHYAPFYRGKNVKPFQRVVSDKKRLIDNPTAEIKRVQRKIARNLLGRLPIPEYLYGAVKGKTIHHNADAHKGNAVVVKMDIKSFYPNMTSDLVYRVWRRELRCSEEVSRLLTRLTTYNGHLPQGAPTSSILANVYLASVYGPVLRLCDELNVVPGVYVDDLGFSGEQARSLMEPTRKLLAKDGFTLPTKKRDIFSARDSVEMTGIRRGGKGPRAPFRKLGDLRAGFHKLKVGAIPDGKKADYVKRLAARVAHIEQICAKDAESYVEQLKTYSVRGS